jgi:hypothetical protein
MLPAADRGACKLFGRQLFRQRRRRSGSVWKRSGTGPRGLFEEGSDGGQGRSGSKRREGPSMMSSRGSELQLDSRYADQVRWCLHGCGNNVAGWCSSPEATSTCQWTCFKSSPGVKASTAVDKRNTASRYPSPQRVRGHSARVCHRQ